MKRLYCSYRAIFLLKAFVAVWGGMLIPPCFGQQSQFDCPPVDGGALIHSTEIWIDGVVNGPPDRTEHYKGDLVQTWDFGSKGAYDVTLKCNLANERQLKAFVPGPLRHCIKHFRDDLKGLSSAYKFSCR
ncbi:MAG: hypothetical protein HQL43_09880 [Alphaproteobacteria bacterium]|nr:hypothetical protein [Alphaproteobacteria bacterium]